MTEAEWSRKPEIFAYLALYRKILPAFAVNSLKSLPYYTFSVCDKNRHFGVRSSFSMLSDVTFSRNKKFILAFLFNMNMDS